MALAALDRPMITVTHTGGNLNHRFTQMEASNVSEERFYDNMDISRIKKSMDYLSVEEYNQLLNHMLSHGKYRDAMFLVCMSNWGMRFSDTCRVRYAHIFDKDGYLKKSFTLPDGEQKTGKVNIYYNNEATATAILLYINNTKRKITPYDYIFVSENSPNKPMIRLSKEEGEILVQKPITHTTGENIIKDNLAEIGIYTRNRKDKSEKMTLDKRFNTHSLRKTFSENFVCMGTQMNRNGELSIDPTIIGLLQSKLMHTNRSTTNRYNQTEEKAFSAICTGMNIGLSVLRQYL